MVRGSPRLSGGCIGFEKRNEPMKRLRTIGMGMLAVTLACMAVHLWVTPLPDWAVRINGVLGHDLIGELL